MWETWAEDADRMAADRHTHFRMSLEWSRLFPDPATFDATTVDELDALVNPAALAGYRAWLQGLRERDIEPVVTVNHYALPVWIHDGAACHVDLETCARRGWVDRDVIVPRIALFAAWCGATFGDEVDLWFTQNEPIANVLAGYLLPGSDRSHPPGLTFATDAAKAVFLHQIEGHAAMYDALREGDTADADADGQAAQVGVVLNFVAFDAETPGDPQDESAREHLEYYYHQVWLQAVTEGAWDPDLDGVIDETRSDLADRLDVIGVNYYNRIVTQGTGRPIIPGLPLSDFFIQTNSGDALWQPYPEGLRRVVGIAGASGRPVWVTENGTPFVEDRGPEILEAHLENLRAAIEEDGVDVRGYLYWSYIDNYEWNHGMDLRFGLYSFDEATKARTARPIASRYAEVIRANALDPLRK
jgi:beta-glucosidase/6-phospho-beta-glucosidase/beta-galactosidase